MGIPTTANADALLNAQDKVKTIQLLSQRIIKTPRTFALKGMANVKWIVEKLGGFPVVGKLLFGSQGKGVFILTEALSAKTTVDTFLIQGNELLLQQYIETAEKNRAKKDFRAVVVDGKVVAAIQRNSVGDDFRTNASLKEDCEGVELDEEMTRIALKCADAVGLAVAGVDLAKDVHTGAIYCYEVNGNMNYKSTEKFSKKNVAKAIAEYAIRLADAGDKDDKKQAQQHAKDFQTSRLAQIYYPRFSGTNHTSDPYRFEISEFSGGVKGIPFGDFSDDDNDTQDDDIETENKSIHFHQSNTVQTIEQHVPVWANTCTFNQNLFEKLKAKGLRTKEQFDEYVRNSIMQQG
jgi:RimK family alpha-L-glutamate ligase